ncbi:MAG: cell division protein FtsI [Proteobacteria bacterium]|nr:MAG: cell division protein FtsI [Pseudomonadota bacterium]
MTLRRPLRPLARVLKARAAGENPKAIEAENLRIRREAIRDSSRGRAESRLLLMAALFACAYGVVGLRMGALAQSDGAEPTVARAGDPIISQRADIVDRNGRVLATNMATHSLYVQTRDLIEPARVAEQLAVIFPELEAEKLLADFTGGRKFLWVRPQISPEQMQAVHDIGDPGLLFGPREMRLYPNGPVAAHVLGGSRFGRQGVRSAEVLGVAGVEAQFDTQLRDPARGGEPLKLSLDLTVQAASEEVLAGGMMLMNARGAASVLMDAKTGEVISIVSLPDFDPNHRPARLTEGNPSDDPLFNRAVQGTYELGSTFKVFTAAQALELGLVNPDTMINTRGPLRASGQSINDYHNYGAELSVTDVIVKSSNIGTGRMALQIGAERQKAFLQTLGLTAPTGLEMVEARTARPMLPREWRDINTVTISYGHGISASPLHLAQAYASVLNGGQRVQATLLKQPEAAPGDQVVSERTSARMRDMLRQVVTRGTASFGDVAGYEVGGKTGSADKPNPRGGYYSDKVMATFAAVFPASDPRYVLVVTLDEPVETSGPKPRRTAGWTAVPVAAEMIRRVAPLLGLRPDADSYAPVAVSLTAAR